MLLNCRDFISEVCPAISDCFVVIFGGVQQGRVFIAFLTAHNAGLVRMLAQARPIPTHGQWTGHRKRMKVSGNGSSVIGIILQYNSLSEFKEG